MVVRQHLLVLDFQSVNKSMVNSNGSTSVLDVLCVHFGCVYMILWLFVGQVSKHEQITSWLPGQLGNGVYVFALLYSAM